MSLLLSLYLEVVLIFLCVNQNFETAATEDSYFHERKFLSKRFHKKKILDTEQPYPEPYIKDYDSSSSFDNADWSESIDGPPQSLHLDNDSTNIWRQHRTASENLYHEESLETTVLNTFTINNFKEDTIPRCPIGLSVYQLENNDIICYKLTAPSKFPPSCPYLLNIDYYQFKNIHNIELTNELVWVHAKKNKVSSNFEWLNQFKNNTVDINIIEPEKLNDSNEDCLLLNRTMLKPVNCNEKHLGICIYDFKFSLNDENCKRKLNETCFSSNIGLLNKCYCVNKYPDPQPRETYCTKLADIEDPYQNVLLSSHFDQDEHCWFGLERSKWMSITDSTKYSYWSKKTNFFKTYGAVGKHGWILENNKILSCAVCEVTIKNNNVELQLKRNFTNNRIQLEIYNALDAFAGVLCFTGNDSYFLNLSISKNNYILQDLWLYNDIINYCWCKTLQFPNLEEVYSNKIVAFNKNMYSNVYVAVFVGTRNQVIVSCPQIDVEIVINSKLINNEEKIVCYYYTIKNNLTLLQEYHILKQSLSSNLILEKFSNANMCLSTNTTIGNKTLHWHDTRIGSTIGADELCLKENGEPVTRTCGGNATTGAEWLPVNGTCVDTLISSDTFLLNDLLHKQTPITNISTELVRVTTHKDNMTSFEIHLVSQLLEKLSKEALNVNLKDVVTTVSNIMQVNTTTLRNTQETLNSTDTILWSLDEILIQTSENITEIGYMSESSEKLLTQATSFLKSDIKGFKLQTSNTEVFDPTKLIPLHHYNENLIQEDLDLALLIPQDLHQNIVQCNGSRTKPTLITSIFYDDVLFNEYDIKTGKPDGKIVSVLIPGFNCSFSAPVQVIFKLSVNETIEVKCAYWVYGSNDFMESIYGHWVFDQEPKILENTSQYRLCEYSHVTHFALLVLGEKTNISGTHKKALDIITAIGSGLSILGLIGVFLTAILFKVYRATNGIVIHFSVAMTAQIILLFIADNVSDNKVACSVFGALLHYVVLSQFFWMLTIAILQYQRYVIIFSNPPNHLVVKACAFAWGIPLLPIIIIAAVSSDNYGKNSNGLCYAVGQYFTFGVLVPIALIILVNVMVFLRIMISVAGSRKIKVHRERGSSSILQLRLAFMLFFLLGLTWGFGLLASIGGSVVYSYLFCITATLQGFILFLFFIVLHEKTRSLWMSIKTCCGKSDEYEVNRDSAASVMMRKTKIGSSDTCTDTATSEILRKVKGRGSSEF